MPRHRRQHDAAPECSDFIVVQDPPSDFFDAALSQPSGRIGFEQVGIDCETENLADEAVDAIARSVLAAADDGLDELDDVSASDGPEIALTPIRQDMDGEIAPVLFGRARPFVTLGMLFEISVGERLKGAGRGGLTLRISGLDWIGAVRHLGGHVLGPLACGFKRRGRVGADGRAQCLAAVRVAEAVSERAGTVGGDSQNESGLPQVRDLEPAAARWLGATQRVGQNLAHSCSFHKKVWWSGFRGWGRTGDAKLLIATGPSRTRRDAKPL